MRLFGKQESTAEQAMIQLDEDITSAEKRIQTYPYENPSVKTQDIASKEKMEKQLMEEFEKRESSRSKQTQLADILQQIQSESNDEQLQILYEQMEPLLMHVHNNTGVDKHIFETDEALPQKERIELADTVQ